MVKDSEGRIVIDSYNNPLLEYEGLPLTVSTGFEPLAMITFQREDPRIKLKDFHVRMTSARKPGTQEPLRPSIRLLKDAVLRARCRARILPWDESGPDDTQTAIMRKTLEDEMKDDMRAANSTLELWALSNKECKSIRKGQVTPKPVRPSKSITQGEKTPKQSESGMPEAPSTMAKSKQAGADVGPKDSLGADAGGQSPIEAQSSSQTNANQGADVQSKRPDDGAKPQRRGLRRPKEVAHFSLINTEPPPVIGTKRREMEIGDDSTKIQTGDNMQEIDGENASQQRKKLKTKDTRISPSPAGSEDAHFLVPYLQDPSLMSSPDKSSTLMSPANVQSELPSPTTENPQVNPAPTEHQHVAGEDTTAQNMHTTQIGGIRPQDDCRFIKPRNRKEMSHIYAALHPIRDLFIEELGQAPPSIDPGLSFMEQHKALQSEMIRACMNRGHSPIPQLFCLLPWTGGLDRWADGIPADGIPEHRGQ